MKHLLDDLNPEQREAVTCMDRPVLVLAGAGSGKTRVITYRIAYSIAEGYSSPWDIFAVTFTNKAAGEMKTRVQKLLDMDISKLWISTFHSACVRILRQHIERVGFKKDFSIYDDTDQTGIIRECLRDMGHDPKEANPRAILSKISSAKSAMYRPSDLRSMDMNPGMKMLADIYEKYELKLVANNALDFDDLLIVTVELLEKFPDVAQGYKDKFKHILIDEYQDTNHVQYRLLKSLSGHTPMICAVGDDDQSIYAWRGADINNILNFEDDYDSVKVVKLERNYRSTQPILDAANRLIMHNERRNTKKLWTELSKGAPVQFVLTGDEMQEANWVAEQIYQWHDMKHRNYSDVAVFYRTHAQSRAFEDIFRGARIPYTIIGGIRFYDRKEVKDLIAYLRLLVNPQDELSAKRIINIPARGIGDKTIEKISLFARASGITFMEALAQGSLLSSISPKTRQKLQQFMEIIGKFRHRSEEHGVSKFIRDLIEELNYFTYLEETSPVDSETRIGNVEELVSAAADYEEAVGRECTLAEYLNEIALLTDVDVAKDSTGTISMMSLHAAKGLEYPLVFMVGMEENLFPSSRKREEESNHELEEERRLCYVGITRAREQLILTATQSRRLYGQLMCNSPSMFIEEIQPKWLNAPGSQRGGFNSGYSKPRESYDGYNKYYWRK